MGVLSKKKQKYCFKYLLFDNFQYNLSKIVLYSRQELYIFIVMLFTESDNFNHKE